MDTAQLHDLLQLLGHDSQVILDLGRELFQRQQLPLNVLQLLLQIDLRCDQLLDLLFIDLRRDVRHLPLDLVQNALVRRPLLRPFLPANLLLLNLLLGVVARRYNRLLRSLGLAALLGLRFGLRFWPRFRFLIRSVARLRSGRWCRLNSDNRNVVQELLHILGKWWKVMKYKFNYYFLVQQGKFGDAYRRRRIIVLIGR